ncbi:hypothetical protein [Pontibacter mangrovi]|uniref:Uncharacterized protein n=1 Tax=Pontibacter mangrovi TaxID=2589816 RepID=A0A501WFV1_9BACT|nr:hypothetical protein [Pontibacter mangrovi]TPE46051.1 hypothetical protein FJM65_01525 [Pontibacter mangrovi]
MKETLPTTPVLKGDFLFKNKTGVLHLKFNGKKYLSWLYRAAALLVLLNIVAIVSKHFTSHPNAWGLIPQFELDRERNIPTYFSSFILLLSSLLLFIVSVLKKRRQGKYTWHWRLLAFIFLYMSVDESAGVHEMFIYPLRDTFALGGVLYFSWVIVGGMLVLGLGLYYLRFLFSLAPKLRLKLMLAGVVYVSGALGVELLGGYYADTYGLDNFTYAFITTIEETLEITGIMIFITALYIYLEQELSSLRFNIGSGEAGAGTGGSSYLKVVRQWRG